MATEMFLKKLLQSLSSLSNRAIGQNEADALFGAYTVAFRGVNDTALSKAADQYKAEGKYFPPKPSELAQYIQRSEESVAHEYDDQGKTVGDYRMRPAMQCQKCRKPSVLCIQEPAFGGAIMCRECYTGMSRKQYESNMRALSRANAKKGRFASWDRATRTVIITNTEPEQEEVDLLDDILGGGEDDDQSV